MKVKSIKATNFRKYSKLSLDLEKHKGINLVIGENGKGKSSIYFAFMYTLFGVCPDGSKGDDIIKFGSKGGTHTEVVFELGNKEYKVTRYRKDKKYKNKVILNCDNEDITMSTISETNKKILELISVPEDIMLSSLVFSPEKVNTFINATDKGRKNFLEQITNTNIYKQAYELVREDLKNARDSLSNNEEALSKVNGLISYQNALEEQYEANKGMYESQKKIYEDKVLSYDEATSETTKKSYYDEVDTLMNQIKQLKTSLSNLEQVKTVDKTEFNKLNQQYLTLQTQQNQLYKTLGDDFTHLKELQNSPKSYCKLCGNLLDKEHKQTEITNLTKALNDNKAKYLNIKKEVTKFEALVKEHQEEIDKQEQEQYKALVSQRELTKLLYGKQNQVNEINNQITNLEQAKQEYLQAKSKLNTLVAPTKPEELNTSYKEEHDKLVNQIKDDNKEIQSLETLSKIYSDQGVKSLALAQSIPSINKTLSPMVMKLTNNKFNAMISSQTENKSGSTVNKLDLIIMNNGNQTSYDLLSSGEKRRISIALNLSFMKYMQLNHYDMNFVVFDEIFDNLDEEGVSQVVSIIKEELDTTPIIFVITHNADLKFNDNFDNIVDINKTKDELVI